MTDDNPGPHWSENKPGETPEQARERARSDIDDAAAKGNKTAQRMARGVARDRSKGQ